ncbi:MAG: S26 family signal peptidase [Armatimonadota bacterium]
MQCPKCGFENIPGREDCLVCSSSMTPEAAEESLYPKRAKDRSLWERITWWLERRNPAPRIQQPADRPNQVRTGEPRSLRGILTGAMPTFDAWGNMRRNIEIRRVRFPRLSIRQIGQLMASAIPGLGHMLVLKNRRRGILILLVTIVMILIAILSYQTGLSNLMVVLIVGLSMYSVWCVYVRFWIDSGDDRNSYQISLGVGLLVLAIYLSTYFTLMMVLSSFYLLVRLQVDPHFPQLADGDTTLVIRHTQLKRGDIIYRIVHGDALTPGQIVGLPGDRIDIGQRVAINGVPMGRVIYPLATGVEKSLILKGDQYWVTPADNLEWFDTPDILAGFCTIHQRDVWGRVIAITGPPERRRRFVRVETSEGR